MKNKLEVVAFYIILLILTPVYLVYIVVDNGVKIIASVPYYLLSGVGRIISFFIKK